MGNPLTISLASLEDRGTALDEFLADACSDRYSGFNASHNAPLFASYADRSNPEDVRKLWLLRDGPSLAGFLACCIRTDNDGSQSIVRCDFQHIFLYPDYRGRGIADQLIAQAAERIMRDIERSDELICSVLLDVYAETITEEGKRTLFRFIDNLKFRLNAEGYGAHVELHLTDAIRNVDV
jgi:GNAT superfamily N-acetyltransferase